MFNFFTKKKSVPEAPAVKTDLASKLQQTRGSWLAKITKLFTGKRTVDPQLLSELEELLLLADVGLEVTEKIVVQVQKELKAEHSVDLTTATRLLKTQLTNILLPSSQPLIIPRGKAPFVMLVVGVNGSGKTTTIGKLAKMFQQSAYKVMLGAGDTFRAAAIAQLKIWGERNQIPVVAQQQGSDSAAVLYDAVQAATARQADILIADTAGRLHTQNNLMVELKKIIKTLRKIDPTAPHEILLVLDATMGQNALVQVKQFHETLGVSGICLTKLDGTAKGGVIFAITETTHIPIRFIGVGESSDDLKPFDAVEFVNALLS